MARIVAAALAVYSFFLIQTSLPHLPVRIPIHFDMAGQPNGWGSPRALWVLLFFQVLVTGVMLSIAFWAGAFPGPCIWALEVSATTRQNSGSASGRCLTRWRDGWALPPASFCLPHSRSNPGGAVAGSTFSYGLAAAGIRRRIGWCCNLFCVENQQGGKVFPGLRLPGSSRRRRPAHSHENFRKCLQRHRNAGYNFLKDRFRLVRALQRGRIARAHNKPVGEDGQNHPLDVIRNAIVPAFHSASAWAAR